MYDHKLETFIAVADKGSFAKASNQLFISSTAVMKQINALEQELHLQLLIRTPTGIELTPAGKQIYKNAKFIIQYVQKSIQEAQALTQQIATTFCVGTSLLNPAKPFIDIWYKINKSFEQYKLHLVPFDDNRENILAVINQLGQKFDFIIGVCDSKAWLSLCRFLPLGRYKKMIAVSKEHPLAQKERLSIQDLFGQTLMMVKAGDSNVNDEIRAYLQTNYPQINIEDTPSFYDLSVFNACAESQKLLLSIECWKEVHPGLVTLPVDWHYTIPYGILYALNPDKDILALVNILKNTEFT